MGNSSKEQMLKMREKGANIIPIWALGQDKGKTYQRRLLDEEDAPKLEDDSFPETSTHFLEER